MISFQTDQIHHARCECELEALGSGVGDAGVVRDFAGSSAACIQSTKQSKDHARVDSNTIVKTMLRFLFASWEYLVI